jgi:TrmH family RNA methyltransferase
MIKITSKENPAVRRAVRLMNSARERRKTGLIICEGARLCGDAAESGVEIEELFCTARAMEKYPDYIEKIAGSAGAAYEISEESAEKISDTESTQGVFIVGKAPRVSDDLSRLKTTGQYVLLENLQDPSNVGAIFRTAEAFGIDGVILTEGCASCFSPKAMRAGMGAMFRIPVFFTDDAPSEMKKAAERNMRPMAAVPRGGAADVTGIRFFKGAVMCVGNEGNGLSEELIMACPEKITIPMSGRAESLNAATAAAILMWEMVRGYV